MSNNFFFEERFERQYGFFRPYVARVIRRYLDCGNIHNGFARVQCADCGHEYLLAFSCKRRHFCPSCHQKRVVQFGEWLCGHLLKAVPHRHFVVSIPKILRRYFLYDRRLLSELSRCAWESLFDALEWLAAMCSHVQNKGEQMVRYYGYYSNVSRGQRKKMEHDDPIPCILEPDGSSKEYRKNWARLIQKT